MDYCTMEGKVRLCLHFSGEFDEFFQRDPVPLIIDELRWPDSLATQEKLYIDVPLDVYEAAARGESGYYVRLVFRGDQRGRWNPPLRALLTPEEKAYKYPEDDIFELDELVMQWRRELEESGSEESSLEA